MSEYTGETADTSSKWTPLSAGLMLALVVATGLMALSYFGYKPEGPDAWTYDWRTLFFSQRAKAQRNDIAIIYVGEKSVADYDYISPVDRGLVARIVEGLDKAGAKAIGLDFIFDRKTESSKTRELLDAIRNARTPVVIGAFDKRVKEFEQENLRFQDDFIQEAGPNVKVGHVYFRRDVEQVKISDQVVRYIVPVSEGRRALSAELADVLRQTKDPATNYIAWQLPPNDSDLFATFKIPRHAPGASVDEIIPPNWYRALKGKIVLVGGHFLDRDRHLIPFSVLDGKKVPGVDIQAQVLAQRLDGRAIHDLPRAVEFVLLAVVCFLGFLISQLYQSKRLDFVLYVVGIGVFVIAGIALFALMSIILPTTLLLFAWTAGVTGAHYSKNFLRRLNVAVRERRKLLNDTVEHSTQ